MTSCSPPALHRSLPRSSLEHRLLTPFFFFPLPPRVSSQTDLTFGLVPFFPVWLNSHYTPLPSQTPPHREQIAIERCISVFRAPMSPDRSCVEIGDVASSPFCSFSRGSHPTPFLTSFLPFLLNLFPPELLFRSCFFFFPHFSIGFFLNLRLFTFSICLFRLAYLIVLCTGSMLLLVCSFGGQDFFFFSFSPYRLFLLLSK